MGGWVDPVTRGWALVTSAGVLRLALGFVASLVIARSLGPADFGVYAVLAATVGIVGGLAEGGLTEAAVLRISAVWPRLKAQALERARAFFCLRLSLAAVFVAVACAVASVVAQRWLNADAGLVRWALVGIVATAASGAVSAMLQATGAFGRMSSLTLVNTTLTAVLAIGLAVGNRLDLLNALVILGIGTSLATFAVGRGLLPTGWHLGVPSKQTLRQEAVQLVRAGRWLWLASVFAMLTTNAEILLLSHWATLPLVGAYGLALNLATKADLVNHSMYTVLLPGASMLRDRVQLSSYVRRGLLRSGLIGAGLLLLVPLSPAFISLFYGADFAPAVPLFQLLIGVMVFDVLLMPLLLLPLAYQQPRLLAAGDAARAVSLIVVGAALIPSFGAPGAIAARFASRVAGAVVVLGALWLARTTLEIQYPESSTVAHERQPS